MRFRRKDGQVVEAFQMTPEMVNNYRAWPKWLQDYWCASPGWGTVTICFAEREGGRMVSAGDWIVRDPTGALLLYQNFAAHYEPVVENCVACLTGEGYGCENYIERVVGRPKRPPWKEGN